MNDPQEPNTSDQEVEAYHEPNTDAVHEPNTDGFQEPNTESELHEPNTTN